MKNLFIRILLAYVFFTCYNPSFSQTDKMAWWRDAHFGMFIHWGVYSVYGNIYNGIDVNGDSVLYDKRCTGRLPNGL